MEHQERIAALDMHIEQGTLIRNAWTDGKKRACLLAALSPEAAEAEDASACPATVMPPWLARLTPDMDDRGSDEAWPAMVRRYAAVARRWHVLDAGAWEQLRFVSFAIIVREARQHTKRANVLAAIDGVLALLDRGIAGEVVTRDEWAKARAAAYAAERRAADAADAAAAAAADAAADADAAAYAAAAAAAAADAAYADAERRAAWDRMTAGILGAIEDACTAAEAKSS